MTLRTIVAISPVFLAFLLNSILAGQDPVTQRSGDQNQTNRQPPRASSDPYFKLPATSANPLPNRKELPSSQDDTKTKSNPFPGSFDPTAKAFDPKKTDKRTGLQPLTPGSNAKLPLLDSSPGNTQKTQPFPTDTGNPLAPKQPAGINLPPMTSTNPGNSGTFQPQPFDQNQFGTTNSTSNSSSNGNPGGGQFSPGSPATSGSSFQPMTSTQPVQQQPNRQTSYESIEPESVVANASQMGPREIAKIPTTAKTEFFESGETLAIVGGEPIFAADLMLEANQLIEKFMAGAPEDLKQKQRKEILPKLLKKYVESKMIYVDIVRGLPEPQALQQINKTLGDHFDREMLPKIIEKNKLKTSSEFDMQLRGQGVSLRQFRQKFIEDEFVRYFLKEKINFDPDVTHQEMLDYYRANADNYRVKERANWEQLVITFAREPDRKKARAAIAKLGNEVVYGAKFEAVAKKGSHGLKAQDGGQQGWVNKGSLVSSELDKQIFSIPLNRLSDIIETPSGFHIIRVKERSQAGLKPFREAQTEINAKLKEKKRSEAFIKHLEKLRREIPVEILIKGVDTKSLAGSSK